LTSGAEDKANIAKLEQEIEAADLENERLFKAIECLEKLVVELKSQVEQMQKERYDVAHHLTEEKQRFLMGAEEAKRSNEHDMFRITSEAEQARKELESERDALKRSVDETALANRRLGGKTNRFFFLFFLTKTKK
jgi:hypothetical protein